VGRDWPRCLQVVEILEIWNLLDAPGKCYNVIFGRQAIFNTVYIGKSLGKQNHYDLMAIPCLVNVS